MTTLKFEEFIKLGFNKNEAKVYVALLNLGRSAAKELIKETEFHKNIVYDNLEKLIEKGLVSFIIEDGKKIFITESGTSLLDFVHKKELELKEERNVAEKLSKEIEEITIKPILSQEAMMFRGVSGVKQVFNDLFKENVDYIGFGGSTDSVNIMGEAYWHNFHVKQKDTGFKGKLLFNHDLRSWGDEMKSAPMELRFTDMQFQSTTETLVWGNTTAIFVWSKKPVVTLIKDELVANSYRNFFEMLWAQGEK